MMEPFELAQLAVKALDDKKARNIKVLKTDKQTVLADYFVICNGTSSTHIKALTETVDEVLSQAETYARSSENLSEALDKFYKWMHSISS